MKDNNWELIAKHLAKETNSEENELVKNLKLNDAVFSKEYSATKKIWSSISINYKNQNYNKERIYNLIEAKISKNNFNAKLKSLLKYAAIIIGALIILGGLVTDLTSNKTITADNGEIKTIILPDESSVHLKQGAEVNYSDSKILGFNRKITLIKGEAFFEIEKDHGNDFIVKTPDYNINVLGTKFNVNCNDNITDVVLAEGKVVLNSFDEKQFDNIILKPGEMVSYHKGGSPVLKEVNPNIYTMWMEDKMEFNRFSINELAEVFKINFNKTVIIKDDKIGAKRIGGSAPSDDFDLILKGISDVLHRNIIHRNDSIIIE